jgi:hypothetical protein
MNASALLQKHGANLENTFPHGPQTIQSEWYQNVYYWNIIPGSDASRSLIPSAVDSSTLTSNPQLGVPMTYGYPVAATILAALTVSTLVLKLRNKAPIASN